MEHNITVGLLKVLLEELDDDDLLIPNTVRNLSIERNGEYWGFINLLENRQEIDWRDENDQD